MIAWLVWSGVFVVGALMMVAAIQCLAAAWPRSVQSRPATGRRPAATVLIPAHNEEAGIAVAIEPLRLQLAGGDEIVVVADNCTDATAERARSAGATVLERTDAARLGKSHALAYGMQWLAARPPEVLVVLDADCVVAPGALDAMVRTAASSGRPVQAVYLMNAPVKNEPRFDLPVLAWTVRNWYRPLGWHRLGMPCFLNGSGMAFPWRTVRGIEIASGRIAEDKWMTVDLAVAGHTVLFCEDALVTSEFPLQARALESQRFRWVHGHMETILEQGPRLLRAAWSQKSLTISALVLDLVVPPLSLLLVLWFNMLMATAIYGYYAVTWIPFLTLLSLWAFFVLSLISAILRFGSPGIMRGLLRAPIYGLRRLPLHIAFLRSRRQRAWVRTARGSGEDRTDR